MNGEMSFSSVRPRAAYHALLIMMIVSVNSSPMLHAHGGEMVTLSASTTPEFSARLIWRREGKISKAQLFVKDNRYRIEHFGGLKTELGFAGVTIVRLDHHKVWYIYSERRLVLSVPATERDELPLSITLEGETKRTLIGDSFVGRRPAQLFEVDVFTQSGNHEMYYEWVDVERGVLLKLLSQDRDWWVKYEHVVVSKQPDYYFEIPLGYRKVEAQETPPKQQRQS